jgi:hypothetical protein
MKMPEAATKKLPAAGEANFPGTRIRKGFQPGGPEPFSRFKYFLLLQRTF